LIHKSLSPAELLAPPLPAVDWFRHRSFFWVYGQGLLRLVNRFQRLLPPPLQPAAFTDSAPAVAETGIVDWDWYQRLIFLLFFFFFFTLVTGPSRSLSLKMSDTRVYGPQIRALGTTDSAPAVAETGIDYWGR